MKSTIITIRSTEESSRVQDILIEAGFGDPYYKKITHDLSYLRAKEDGSICFNIGHLWYNDYDISSILRGSDFTLSDAKRIVGAGTFSKEIIEMSVKELSEYVSHKEGRIVEIKVRKD